MTKAWLADCRRTPFCSRGIPTSPLESAIRNRGYSYFFDNLIDIREDMSDRTFKQLTYVIGAVYLILFLVFIIYDLAIRPSTEVPVVPSGGGWVLQPIIDSLFISFAGLTFVILGVATTVVAWTRTADEYVKLLTSTVIGGLGKSWFSVLPNRFWLWQGRLITPLLCLMGITFLGAGIYSLFRHFL
jgi:hypothetical protein